MPAHLRPFLPALAALLCTGGFSLAEPEPKVAALDSKVEEVVRELKAGAVFAGRDTLKGGEEAVADAAACLAGLRWTSADFSVELEAVPKDGNGNWLVRFPSPVPSGDQTNDRVAMEWNLARDADGKPVTAPAVVVVHESGRGMHVGRTIARSLRGQGLHTFLLHLPGYGQRTSAFGRDVKNTLPALKQAVADVRRARDAVACLPFVDAKTIGLQGTSLGGFVVAAVAGLDRGYDRTFIVLAGGQISEVLLKGKHDAANMKKRFLAAGITEENIREYSLAVEPMRLAHRVDPTRLWMFTGRFDDVVPPACSKAFAEAVKLTPAHHYMLPVGHYSGAVLLPIILPEIKRLMLESPPVAKPDAAK